MHPIEGPLATLIFWAAFTALIPQAPWVRRTAPLFGGAPGPLSGSAVPESKATQPAGEALRMVGPDDSIIDGVGCRALEQALIGATAAALARRLDRRVDRQARGRFGLRTRDIRISLLPAPGKPAGSRDRHNAASLVAPKAAYSNGLARRRLFRIFSR